MSITLNDSDEFDSLYVQTSSPTIFMLCAYPLACILITGVFFNYLGE